MQRPVRTLDFLQSNCHVFLSKYLHVLNFSTDWTNTSVGYNYMFNKVIVTVITKVLATRIVYHLFIWHLIENAKWKNDLLFHCLFMNVIQKKTNDSLFCGLLLSEQLKDRGQYLILIFNFSILLCVCFCLFCIQGHKLSQVILKSGYIESMECYNDFSFYLWKKCCCKSSRKSSKRYSGTWRTKLWHFLITMWLYF